MAVEKEIDLSGYVMIPGWLLDRQPSANAIAVYCRLAQFGTFNNDKGTYERIFPRLATLSERAALSESTVKRSITELIQVGAIERTERWGEDGKTRLPSVYRVIFGSLVGPDPTGVTGGPTPNMGKSDLGGSTGEPRVGSPVDPPGVTGDLEPRTSYPEVFDQEENPPPHGRPEVTTRASGAAKEGEGDSTDSTKADDGNGPPAQSVLDALVAEIHTLTPGHSPESIRDALEAARGTGKSVEVIAAAARSLARGDYGPTQFGFKGRLLTDGPWWAGGAGKAAAAAAASRDRAPKCPRHRGQLATACAPCAGEAYAPPPADDGQVMKAATARQVAAEKIAATVAKRKIANDTHTRSVTVTAGEGATDGPGQMPSLPEVDPAAGVSRRPDAQLRPRYGFVG